MLKPLKYQNNIVVSGVPVEWLPLIKLFDPYLPHFPICYIHRFVGTERVYGFPVYFTVSKREKGKCRLEFVFLCNKDLGADPKLKSVVENELAERIGLKNKVVLSDLISSCKGDKKLKRLISELWEKNIKRSYGNCLPFGRLYEEVFSIVRFTSAFNPLSGRKSEMQMVYDFISNYGERIPVGPPWSHLEFYLLPSYEELINRGFGDFPRFRRLFNAMKRIFNIFYTKEVKIGDIKMKLLPSGTFLTTSSGDQFRSATEDLKRKGVITANDKKNLDFLLDAFNRYPPRVRIFITFVCNLSLKNGYHVWTGQDVKHMYIDGIGGRGMSPKVLSCFLQQGFGNTEVVPIDNWVEAFYSSVFNMRDKKEFLDRFSKIGKLERLVWILSQARKTNSQLVFDQLWCIKYGTQDDKLRGPNPLSCYFCSLRKTCLGFSNIKNEKVYIASDRRKATQQKVKNCRFVVETEGNIPKKVYRVGAGGNLDLVDVYSGYFVHEKKVKKSGVSVKVGDFIRSL